jgi:hypothetical protein
MGALDLTASKDLKIFLGGSKTMPSVRDINSLVQFARQFSENQKFSMKLGCSVTGGYFFNRGLNPQDRTNAITGASFSGSFNPIPGFVVGGNQNLPFPSGAQSVEFGFGESNGITVGGSTEIFDLKKAAEERARNANFSGIQYRNRD